MWTWLGVLVLTATLSTGAVAQQVDTKKLRQIVRTPRMSIEAALSFTSGEGFEVLREKPDVPKETGALRKAMKGDATDAERCLRLGELYSEVNDPTRARADCVRAVKLFRQRSAARPRDGRLLTQLARALRGAGMEEEAEATLRQAVQVAPREWQSWIDLGELLTARAVAQIMNVPPKSLASEPLQHRGELQERFDAHTKKAASPRQLAEAAGLLDEASNYFERAIVLAPKEPATYRARTGFRLSQLQRLMLAGGGSEGVSEAQIAVLLSDAIADAQRAAELRPNSYQAIGAAALLQAYAILVRNRQDLASKPVWSVLPEPSRQAVRAAMARLEKLAQSRTARTAAGASFVLGAIRFFITQDLKGAEAKLRRSVALDPSREQAWELLAGLLLQAERFPDLLVLLRERVRHHPMARNHLLLAKAYEKANQLEKAIGEVEAALRREPTNFTAILSLAVLLMKRGDASALPRVQTLMGRAGDTIGNSSPPEQWIDYAVTRGIYFALIGDVDLARQQLQQVLETEADHKEAREALAVLRSEP